jgi:hypothetical protein
MLTIRPLKLQMNNLTDTLSTIDVASEKLFDIDPDWECSSAVISGMLHPYYEILQEKKKHPNL